MRNKEEILKGEQEDKFMLKCALSPALFAERVLGLTLKPFHREWLQILNTYDNIVISAPTGFGKTKLFGVAFPIWQAFFKPNSQSLIISKNIRTQSSNVLEEIKSIIEDNEILQNLVPDESKFYWTKEKINTTNRSKIFYSSYTMNVRGAHVDYVFCDEVATYPESETFFRDVVTRVTAKKGKIAAVSTCVHTADLLAKLMRNKLYFSKVYPAIVNNESIWPEKYPLSTLMRMKVLDEPNFEKNYMCNPRSESENTIFSLGKIMEGFNYERRFTSDYEGGQVFLGCDFAVSKGVDADFDAYVAIEKVNNLIFIKHIEIHRGIPTSFKVQRIKQLFELFKPIRVIIDESGIGVSILDELRALGLPAIPQSFHSIARTNLLMNLKNIIDGTRLIIPRHKDDFNALNLTDELVTQLIGFKEAKNKIGNIQYLSTSAHDDIVMALAIAAKEATRMKSSGIYVASGS
jgi:hypothetical protein